MRVLSDGDQLGAAPGANDRIGAVIVTAGAERMSSGTARHQRA
jgi:hypothetical protein